MSKQQLPVLVSWVGGNDLKRLLGSEAGPVFSTLRYARFSRAELLYSDSQSEFKEYQGWLMSQTDIRLRFHHEP